MLETALTIGLAIVLAAVGDVLLSRGMQDLGEVRVRRLADVPPLLKCVFTHPVVLLGVLAMAGYFGSYMAALVWVDVSVVNPLTALSYLLATIYAASVMREKVGLRRAAGVALITVGAILVGISS